MKVLHISTLGSGGEFNAAKRLHLGLLEMGVESVFLTLQPTETSISGHILFPEKSKYGYSIEKRIRAKTGLYQFQSALRAKERKQVDAPLECFSSPTTDFKLAAFIHDVIQPDVVNIHWVANFIDYRNFFSEIKMPVVWTLHDENPYGGYWHYEGDRIDTAEAESLHRKYVDIKHRAIQKHRHPLKMISPSEWLGKSASNSKVLGGFHAEVVRNGLNTHIFCNRTGIPNCLKSEITRNQHLKGLFICQSVDNPRKGMPELIEALKDRDIQNIRLIAVGNASKELKEWLPSNTIFTGSIESEDELAELYSFADFTIIPSREDNLPNTLLESLCCGTPVVATPAGGLAEILQNAKLGILSTGFSSTELKLALEMMVKEAANFDPKYISKTAVELFNLEKQAQQYYGIYKALKSHGN